MDINNEVRNSETYGPEGLAIYITEQILKQNKAEILFRNNFKVKGSPDKERGTKVVWRGDTLYATFYESTRRVIVRGSCQGKRITDFHVFCILGQEDLDWIPLSVRISFDDQIDETFEYIAVKKKESGKDIFLVEKQTRKAIPAL